MSSTTTYIIAGVIILFILFLVAKLAIRWAIRVAIVGLILAALLGTGGFWWWTNHLSPKPKPTPTRQPPTPGKRSTQ
jgi:energy-coupling factor transporter transmembrane protein EcfT